MHERKSFGKQTIVRARNLQLDMVYLFPKYTQTCVQSMAWQMVCNDMGGVVYVPVYVPGVVYVPK